MSGHVFTRCSPLLAALLVTACATSDESRTSVVVIIDAEDAVKQQAADLALIVTDLSDGKARAVHDDSQAPTRRAFPHRIALVPTDDDAARTYRLEAHALAGGQAVAVARLISGYVAHQTRYVRIVLEDACIGKTCAEDETCHAATCVPAESAPEKFAHDATRAPVSTSVASKGNVPGREVPVPGIDAATPDAGSAEPDAQPTVEEDAGAPSAEVEGGLPSEQDAAVQSPDSAIPDAAVDAQVVDSGPQHVCDQNTPYGCYTLVREGSYMDCPPYHPGTASTQPELCLGIYFGCAFVGPQGQMNSCVCDWTHWLCQ